MTVPVVFISYSHDSPEHKDRVLELANRLRAEGIDCSIDQYEQSPEEGWPQWCERQLERATFVLVVCTETYRRRFQGEEAPHEGRGGTWEAHIIRQHLYNAQGRNIRFIPVIFCQEDAAFIPLPLQSATAYQLDGQYYALYRRLTPKPEHDNVVAKPPPHVVATPWQVRHRRNVFFTGREQILANLRHMLDKQGTAALSGLGGVGKTQTAVEYAYQNRERYRAVFWAAAESRETLVAAFVETAGLLGLPSAQAQDQQLAVDAVKRWLEANPGWLLVFDNADELSLVQSFVPQQKHGHVLLTTRASATHGLAERIAVKAMEPEESALLLLRRAGVIAKDQSSAAATTDDRGSALQLANELGGLPLALDQAGAFMQEEHRTLSEYFELFASEKSKLLAERGTLGDHASVTRTFSLAFDKVASNSAAAADLLRLCAFLAPDSIPEEIFTAGDAAKDKLAFTRMVGHAVRFSLLERDPANQTLHIHRIVQLVIKAGMPKAEQKVWAERAITATENAFPAVEFANWGLCQRLLAHAETCASLIQEWEFDFLDAAKLLNQTAYYLAERALFVQAEPLYKDSLAIYKRALGPDHPDVAASLNNLASLYNSQGKYTEAEPLYHRSLAILEKALGPDHTDVATALNNLASLHYQQGKYAEAEPLLQRSLAIGEKPLGPDHTDVATALNNLASLYDSQGKYAEAEPLYHRSLAIKEKALGPDHPAVATSLNNLAGFYRNQGKYAEAEPLYHRSLAIRENALGPDHPEVAQSFNNLAALYGNQGKHAEAEPLYQRSLAIREKALSPDYPDVAQSVTSLAVLYCHQGKYAEAEPLCQRSFAICEKALGPDHPAVATSLNNLAGVYLSQGKYAEAEPLYYRSLAIRDKALGPDHPEVAQSFNNVADLYRRQGKYAEAEPLCQRSLAIREKALGSDHPDVARSLNNLAILYGRQGKYVEAEPLHRRALAIWQKELGLDHPDLAITLNNLAVLYHSQGKYVEAEPLCQRALTIFEKMLGPEHPNTKSARTNLEGIRAILAHP